MMYIQRTLDGGEVPSPSPPPKEEKRIGCIRGKGGGLVIPSLTRLLLFCGWRPGCFMFLGEVRTLYSPKLEFLIGAGKCDIKMCRYLWIWILFLHHAHVFVELDASKSGM